MRLRLTAGAQNVLRQLAVPAAEATYQPLRGVLGKYPWKLNGLRMSSIWGPVFFNMGVLQIVSGDPIRGCTLRPTDDVRKILLDPTYVPECALAPNVTFWSIREAIRKGTLTPDPSPRTPFCYEHLWRMRFGSSSVELLMTEQEACRMFELAFEPLPVEELWRELYGLGTSSEVSCYSVTRELARRFRDRFSAGELDKLHAIVDAQEAELNDILAEHAAATA